MKKWIAIIGLLLVSVNGATPELPIPDKNQIINIPGQPLRAYQIIDVSKVNFSRQKYVKRRIAWRPNYNDFVAYKVYVKEGGNIKYVYVTPSPVQDVWVNKVGNVTVWITAFNAYHQESAPSATLRFVNGEPK